MTARGARASWATSFSSAVARTPTRCWPKLVILRVVVYKSRASLLAIDCTDSRVSSGSTLCTAYQTALSWYEEALSESEADQWHPEDEGEYEEAREEASWRREARCRARSQVELIRGLGVSLRV